MGRDYGRSLVGTRIGPIATSDTERARAREDEHPERAWVSKRSRQDRSILDYEF